MCYHKIAPITITVPAIPGKLEASGAAALVGPRRVVTLVCTEASGEVPAFVQIYNRTSVQDSGHVRHWLTSSCPPSSFPALPSHRRLMLLKL